MLQQLDARILRERAPPADRLRRRHRITRRSAHHDDVAFAAQRLDQPFRRQLSILDLAFGGDRCIVLADLACEIVASAVGYHGHAGRSRLARGFQDGGAAVELCDDDVILLRDQRFDVGNLLLRFELAVGVASFSDVLALRGFVLELGTGQVAPVIAAPTIRIRDLDRLGPQNLDIG